MKATKPDLRAAVVQMVSSDSVEQNLLTAEVLIAEASQKGAELVVLPEYFALMPSSDAARAAAAEKSGEGKVQDFLSAMAVKHNVWIVGGSHPIESGEEGKFFGRCFIFDNLGVKIAHYDKIHLFDVKVNHGRERYCESDYTQHGEKIVAFDSPWGKIGIAICYDLRFPEMFRLLQKQGVELMVIPAAFTETTGKAHWHCLLKARAVENLCFVLASAQGGQHANGRSTYGHSTIYSPWGERLAELTSGEGVAVADLDFLMQKKIRTEFPALDHRRL